MSYSDPKEDVISLELTPYGKYLLSVGKLNPAYYAFFDDDIIYDSSYAGVTDEAQNNIEKRIFDETPRFKAQGVTTGRETDFISIKNEPIDSLTMAFAELAEKITDSRIEDFLLDRFTMPYEIMENTFRQQSLGKCNPETGFAPAWNVSLLKAPLSSSSDHLSISSSLGETIDHIPQLDVNIQYHVRRNSEKYNRIYEPDKFVKENDADPFDPSSTNFPDSISLLRFQGGESIEVLKDYLVIKLEESNTFFEKDNFEIEFFEESAEDGQGTPIIHKKEFYIDGEDYLEDLLRNNVSKNSVEYRYDLHTDEEIGEDLMCPLITRDRTRNFFVTTIYDCENSEVSKAADGTIKYNIYADSENSEDIC